MYNIYCIKSQITNIIYVGITAHPIEERFQRHIKHSYDKNHKGLLYEEMRKYKRKTFYIELIEETNDKSRETYWIKYYQNNPNYICLNEKDGMCQITKEDLYNDYVINKMSSRDIAKKYNIKSKTTILNMLKNFGIKYRNSRKLCLNEDAIYDDYLEYKSIRLLAKLYNVDRDVIRRIISKYNSPSNS